MLLNLHSVDQTKRVQRQFQNTKIIEYLRMKFIKIYSNQLLQRCIKIIAAFQMQEKGFGIMEMGIRSQQRNPKNRVLPQ